MNKIEIYTDEIQLDQFLKWAGIVDSGGQVKFMIQDKIIYLNDNLVTEKRKKIHNNDIITIKDIGCWQVLTKNGE